MEHFFACPHCGERISILLDPSVAEQSLIEDCEVCCRPIAIRYVIEDGALADFSAEPE